MLLRRLLILAILTTLVVALLPTPQQPVQAQSDWDPVYCDENGEPPRPELEETTAGAGGGGMGGGGGGGGPTLAPGTLYPGATPPVDMFFQDYGVNPFLDTEDDHLSTFAMDVDTASYSLARTYIRDYGQLPPTEAVRPEEFINYYGTDYELPEGDEAFAINLHAAPAPFGFEDHYLMRVGLQARAIAPEDREPVLLVFVVDVSGSMDMNDRIELVKDAMILLLDELRPDDQVGIVVYTDEACVLQDPIAASEVDVLHRQIMKLHPQQSTNAAAGLQFGYAMASHFMRDDGLNRVILLSDGVANVGETGPDEILEMVQDQVDQGITLTSVGVGMGNFNDVLLEQLANNGDGNYYYVDGMREIQRVFKHNLVGTLQVVAFDARVQVDFNPEVTDRYRLIGYENRAIADEDFRNDEVDAGEVGAGHAITALYELALEGEDVTGTIATVYVRYRDPDTDESVELSRSLTVDELIGSFNAAPPDFQMHALVAEYSELLRESYWAQEGNLETVLGEAMRLHAEYPDIPQIAEFIELVQMTQSTPAR